MTATEVGAPQFACPKCHENFPHATTCRQCGKELTEPYCMTCRTYTAPIDKRLSPVGDGQFARKGCAHCKYVPSDDELKVIGDEMLRWAIAKVETIKPPKMEQTVTTKATGLPIRVVSRKVEIPSPSGGKTVRADEVIEYDVPMKGLKGETVICTQSVHGDTPMGQFLQTVLKEHESVCSQLQKKQEQLAVKKVK